MADEREIAGYYDRGVEQGRLADWGRLEFLRTRELLSRFLPAPPATVLDVGGAAGAYALPLAAEGYVVHLLDPGALRVEQAEEASEDQAGAPLASIAIGDARELPYDDESADVVLMLGPLYHLTEAVDRGRALGEARRVLRPGGLLAAAAITRFASTLDGVAQASCSSRASRRSSSATSPTAGAAHPEGLAPLVLQARVRGRPGGAGE
jgi:ubiquinone/menaquinone biosynthesis C-methylase UbiE